jgi:hypothetical protein
LILYDWGYLFIDEIEQEIGHNNISYVINHDFMKSIVDVLRSI